MAKDKKATKTSLTDQERRTWFDKLSSRKQDLVCILILYALILLLFGKIVFSNMQFSESPDAASHDAFMKAVQHIKETEGVEPLWLPYIFSGMPVFAGLLFPRDVNFLEQVLSFAGKILFLNSDLSWFVMHYFLMGVFMYWLARQLGFSQLPSLLAAVTLMLNPFAIGLAQSGHGSKLITLSYVPLLFLVTHNLFRKRDILSFALLAIVTGTLLLSRHPQIAFYGLLMIGSYFIYEIFFDIRSRSFVFVRKAALFVVALALGFAIYSYEFLPTNEYSKYSIRGGSETGVSKGLDYNYATSWSFHPYEALTYIVPSFFGFSTQYTMEYQGQEQQLPLYWGWMPFTDGPVYIGIIPILLGIIAFVYNRNRLAWFLALLSLLALFLSFGKYFGLVYDLFFNYFPYFNKFRVPVLILYLIPVTVGLLAANGGTFLQDLSARRKEINVEKLKKRCLLIGGIVLASLVLGFIARDGLKSFLSGMMFTRAEDRQFNPQAIPVLKELRFDVFWSYYVGFALMVAAFFGLIAAFINRKIGSTAMAFGFVIILTVDLYLMDTKFITPQPRESPRQEQQLDQTLAGIKAESDSSVFRVLPVGDFDQANLMMYHHIQSVEGYSPAKIKIYQDIRDSCFARNGVNVFDMLNVKYVIRHEQAKDGSVQTLASVNPKMLPRAWFVDTAVISASKGETFGYLNSPAWNPRSTAILEQALPENIARPDSSQVVLERYRSRDIVFKTYSSATSLLVVSEVYYPAGWYAFVDGRETEIHKTNYVLRSVVVPAGNHTVEFKFDPPMYEWGYTLSQIGWGASALLLLAGLFSNPWIRERIGFGRRKNGPADVPSA